jgi:hypothetical protein
MGCFAAGAIVYYGVLANCDLFCKNVIEAEYRSPGGKWKAIRFLRKCTPVTGYCPDISCVSILPIGDQLPRRASDGIAIDGDDGIGIEWKSEGRLIVSYPGIDRVIRRPDQVGVVKIDYRPIGFL